MKTRIKRTDFYEGKTLVRTEYTPEVQTKFLWWVYWDEICITEYYLHENHLPDKRSLTEIKNVVDWYIKTYTIESQEETEEVVYIEYP